MGKKKLRVLPLRSLGCRCFGRNDDFFRVMGCCELRLFHFWELFFAGGDEFALLGGGQGEVLAGSFGEFGFDVGAGFLQE